MSCRHRDSWLLCGGRIAWCPDCGAVRQLAKVPGQNASYPVWYRWIKPEGQRKALAALDRVAAREEELYVRGQRAGEGGR